MWKETAHEDAWDRKAGLSLKNSKVATWEDIKRTRGERPEGWMKVTGFHF